MALLSPQIVKYSFLQEAIRKKPGSSFSSTDLVISLASWSPQKSSPSVLAPPDATMHRNN